MRASAVASILARVTNMPALNSARRWFAGWTLRRRLLVSVLALLALICVLLGLVTNVLLSRYLVAQVDNRLMLTAGHARGGPPHDRSEITSRPGSEGFVGPGDPPGVLYATLENGKVASATYLDDDADSTVKPTSADQNAVLQTIPADNQPVSREVPGLGHYRLVAESGQSEGETIVSGLPLSDVDNTVLRLTLTEVFVGLAGLIVVGLVGEEIIRRTLRPLNRVAATAGRVSELQLDRGEVALSERVPDRDTDPRTEVGQVGSALNRMLGHVASALAVRQASETRVRQFVADASHELRTPLAAIRGYAELARRVSGPIPDDVAHAMMRVESASTRMTTLVEELLMLARLDNLNNVGRSIDRKPVDLSMLVVDAVSDAHAAGPDHTWRLVQPDEPVVIAGDAQQLHQAVANLLANASVHTPPGTTVTVTLSGPTSDATPGGEAAAPP